MCRSKVIAVINELVQLGFVRKLRVIKKDGSYSDNHYSVVEPEPPKKEESPQQSTILLGTFYLNYSDYSVACQAEKRGLFVFLSGVVP